MNRNRTVSNILLSSSIVASAVATSLAVKQYRLGSEAYNQTLNQANLLNQYPLAFAILWGGVALNEFLPRIAKAIRSDEPLLNGLGPMQREPYSPRPTPRKDYDVMTGLPNHRASPERVGEILADLAAKEQPNAGNGNNAPWCGAQPGCWDTADALTLRG